MTDKTSKATDELSDEQIAKIRGTLDNYNEWKEDGSEESLRGIEGILLRCIPTLLDSHQSLKSQRDEARGEAASHWERCEQLHARLKLAQALATAVKVFITTGGSRIKLDAALTAFNANEGE